MLGVAAVIGGSATPASAVDPQWWYQALSMGSVAHYSRGAGVTIAVIDSGIAATAPDLAGAPLVAGKDFCTGDGGSLTDQVNHGTGVAALISGTGKGRGGTGVRGLASAARVLSVKVADGSSQGLCGTAGTANTANTANTMAAAIRYAADAHAAVINISITAPDTTPAETAAVGYAQAHGCVVVAAAGNDGDTSNAVEYPAASPGVVSVAASSQTGTHPSFSESNDHVVLAAPGEQMLLPVPPGNIDGGQSGYADQRGTSLSAPLVSATAALVKSRWPSLTAGQVIRQLIGTATDAGTHGRDPDFGFGIIDPLKAVRSELPSLARSNPLPARTGTGSPTVPGRTATSSPPAPPTPSDPGGRASHAHRGGPSAPAIAFSALAFVVLVAAGYWSLVARRRR